MLLPTCHVLIHGFCFAWLQIMMKNICYKYAPTIARRSYTYKANNSFKQSKVHFFDTALVQFFFYLLFSLCLSLFLPSHCYQVVVCGCCCCISFALLLPYLCLDYTSTQRSLERRSEITIGDWIFFLMIFGYIDDDENNKIQKLLK